MTNRKFITPTVNFQGRFNQFGRLLKNLWRLHVEADIFHHYTETATGLTAEYKSVIGFGTAEVVYDDEAIKGLNF